MSNYPLFKVMIDWRNDGDYSQPGADVTQRSLTRTAMAVSYGRDQGRALSPVKPGAASLELNNVSRDYSPENLSSPISGNLVPARPVWVTVTQDAFTYNFYRGFIDDFVVLPSLQDRSLQISCLDTLARFQQVKLSTTLYGPGVRTGAAINALLDQLNWPSNMRDIDPGATTIRWWWEEGTDGLAALNKILGAEGLPAIAFVDAVTGKFVFRDRHHRLLRQNSLVPQAVFSGGTIPETDGVTNLIPYADSDFESALTGNWVAWSNLSTPVRDSTQHYGSGEWSLKLVATAAGAAVFPYSPALAAYGSQAVTISFAINSPVSTSGSVTIYWNPSLGSSSFNFSLVSGWNLISQQLTPPAGCTSANIWPSITATGSSQAFYLDKAKWISLGTATFSAPMTYDMGWRDIVNTISISVSDRSVAGELADVWTSDDTRTIPNGATVTVTAQGSDPFLGAVVPEEDTDYTLESGSVNVSISRTSGQTTVISLTDTAGGTILTSLKLRAFPVTVSHTDQVSIQDAESADDYGVRGLPSTVDLGLACAEDVSAVGRLLLARYARRRPTVTIPVSNMNSYRLSQQLNRDLSDRVHIVEYQTGLDADFFIEQISHSADDAGMLLTTTFGCEKDVLQPGNAFTFNASGQGFNDGAFGITGLDSSATVFIFNDSTRGKFNVGAFGT